MRTFSAILVFAALAAATSAVYTGPSDDDFYAMDKRGAYHFAHNDGRIARQEVRSPEGVIRGAYSYVDSRGEIQTISYTADKHNGFVASGSSIPRLGKIPEEGEYGDIVEVPPAGAIEDTAEVIAARSQHLEAVRKVQLGLVPSVPLPKPIEYAPEVAAARIEHLNIHAVEALRNSGQLPVVYVSQPAIQYIAPAAQYHPAQFHPDHLSYVGL